MNIHHITKSLFVGAAIVGIGMSSGKAEITFSPQVRQQVRGIVTNQFQSLYGKLNEKFPWSFAQDLQNDVDTICGLLFSTDNSLGGFVALFSEGTRYRMSGCNPSYPYKSFLIMDLNRVSGLYANPTATVRKYLLQSFSEKQGYPESPELMGHLGGKHLNFFNRLSDVFYKAKETLTDLHFCDESQTPDGGPHYWINREFIFDESFAERIANVMYGAIMHQLGRDAYYLHIYRFLKDSIPEEPYICAYVEDAFKNECRYQRIAHDVATGNVTTDTKGAFLRFFENMEKLFFMRLILRYIVSEKDGGIMEDVNSRLNKIQEKLETVRKQLQQ